MKSGAGLVTAVLLLTACSGAPPAASGAPLAAPSRPPSATAAAQAMLDRRAEAFLTRDEGAFEATVATSAGPAQRQTQLAAFASSVALPFRSFSLQIAAHAGPPPAGGRWVVLATLSYALAGYDAQPVTLPRTLALTRSAAGWAVAADTQLDAPWDFGPLVVLTGARSLVIATSARRSAATLVQRLAEAAVPVVTRAWGTDWPQRVVIVVPDTVGQLEAEVGTTGDLSHLAAVQSAELTGAHVTSGDRIVVNPDVFLDKTSAVGQRVVLTHEITHVASAAATTAGVPLWLVEGLADTVAFGTTPLTPLLGAPELAAAIKAGMIPTELPANAAFSADSPTLVTAYEQAWLACRLITKTVGLASLVALYRAVGGGESVPAALAQRVHTTLAHFTAAWRASLRSELA